MHIDKITSQSSLLQDEQSQLPQYFLTGEALQISHHLCSLPLSPLWKLHISLVQRSHLDTELQMWPHQSTVEGQDHLPGPAGHSLPDAAQDATGPGQPTSLSTHVTHTSQAHL